MNTTGIDEVIIQGLTVLVVRCKSKKFISSIKADDQVTSTLVPITYLMNFKF